MCIRDSPFAPHITEELFETLGFGILNEQKWAEYDESLCADSTVEIVVQINGKLKGRFNAPAGSDKDALIKLAFEQDDVKKLVDGKTIVKQIAVPDKLVNIVVK